MTDLLVVGAGTTGLTLALQAHDHGATVRVLERRRELGRPSRAMIVHPRTLEVLRPLGVSEELLARGDPAPTVRLHLGGREVVASAGELAYADTAFPPLLFEAQAQLERALSEALARRGVEVERGTELVGLRSDPFGCVAHLRRSDREEFVECRYVAGCDGAASTVRHAVGVGWKGGRYPQEAVLADVELEGDLSPRAAHAAAGRTGLVLLFPHGERASWRLVSTRPARESGGVAGQPDGPVSASDLKALINAAGLEVRVADVAWSARVPLEHRLSTAYRVGSVFLVGDAAHVHSPAGGQGMNAGIQDAANLGWKLAFAASAVGEDVTEPLLASYEVERRSVALHVLALTHILFWGEAGIGPAATFARSALAPAVAPFLPIVLRRRRLAARALRLLSGLDIRYRHSPISVDVHPDGHAPPPGARLPDGAVTVEGLPYRLHELLARPGVHLLFGRDAATFPGPWPGPLVHAHRVDDWSGRGAVAVRPDGYVGFRSNDTDEHQIGQWLAMVGLSGRPWADGRAHGKEPREAVSPGQGKRA